MQEPKRNNLYKIFYGILLLIVVLFILFKSGFKRTENVVTVTPLPNNCLNQKIPHYAKSLFIDDNLNIKKDEYSFVAAGHIYGSHRSAQQGRILPAATLLNNISLLKSLESDFFVSLGDSYWGPEFKYINSFISSVIETLDLPFIIAPGNHEIGNDASIFCNQFGPVYYRFSYGFSEFIVLNTGLDGRAFLDDIQLSFLMSVIQSLNETEELKHLFILSHKFIWAPEDPVMQVISKNRIYKDLINQYNDANFYKDVLPIIKMAKKPIYWLTGDLKPLPLFFHKINDVTYIATHIYDDEQDAVIQVKISNESVTFHPISLSGEKLEPLEHYNVKYWEDWYAKNNFDTQFQKGIN